MKHHPVGQWSVLLLFAVLLAFLEGCSRPDSTEKFYPITGTVRMNGRPVAGATVVFVPVDGNGTSAVATTDARGQFQLATPPNHEGARVGSYKVAISKSVADRSHKEPTTFDEMEKATQAGQLPQAMEFKSVIPELYGTPETSPLEANVRADAPNEFAFDIES